MEVLVRGGGAPWRPERHEKMRRRIDSLDIDRLEWLESPGTECHGDPFVAPGRCQHRPEFVETAFGLSRPGLPPSRIGPDKTRHFLVGYRLGRSDERSDLREQLGRMGLSPRARLTDGGLPEELVCNAVG